MGDSKRRYVNPGEVITTGPYRPEQNVFLDGKKIIATRVGISSIAFKEPLDCHSSFCKIPFDFKTE